MDGKQLCSENVWQPLDYFKDDLDNITDLCGFCVRHLNERLRADNETSPLSPTELLKVLRGDYDAEKPNKFWRDFGITKWS